MSSPWCWNIYLQNWVFLGVNVTEHMGAVCWQSDRPEVAGCASHLKMSTAQQREQWQAESDERVARAHVRFSQNIARTTKHEHWKHDTRFTMFYLGLSLASFLLRFTKHYIAPATKNSPEASEVLRLPHAMFDPFKTSSKFAKYCACHTTWPPKAPLILTHACQL